MSSATSEPALHFARAVQAVEAELPWEELGARYCYEGGESFFEPDQVDAIREAGLKIAAEVAARLEEVGERRGQGSRTGPQGASLYAGAAVAELVPALCECLVLGRSVRLLNLPGPEPTLLNGALARAEASLNEALRTDEPLRLPRIETERSGIERAWFDHLWLTSVLTDPEAFPALHDSLYGLLPTSGARPFADKEPTRRGNLPAEEKRARELLRGLVVRVDPPAVVTTSDEELGLVRAAFEERGLRLSDPTPARLSAIVGDPLRSYVVS